MIVADNKYIKSIMKTIGFMGALKIKSNCTKFIVIIPFEIIIVEIISIAMSFNISNAKLTVNKT